MTETISSVIKNISDILRNTHNDNYLATKLILLNINEILSIPKSHINAFMKLFFNQQNEYHQYDVPKHFLYVNPICILCKLILYNDSIKSKSISNLLHMYNLIPNSYNVDISIYSILVYTYLLGGSKKELELIKFIYNKYNNKNIYCSWVSNILKSNLNYNNVTNFLSIKYDTNEEITEDISFDDIIFEKYKIDYSKLRNELRIEWELNNKQIFDSYIKTIKFLTSAYINKDFIDKYMIYNNEIDVNLKRVLNNFYKSKIKLIDSLYKVKYGNSSFGNLITNLAIPSEYLQTIGKNLYNNIDNINIDVENFINANDIIKMTKEFNNLTTP